MNGESYDSTKKCLLKKLSLLLEMQKRKQMWKVTFEGELATAVPASVTKLGNVLFGDWERYRAPSLPT